ncbi:MAG: NTP transferase domain-containing protein [Flavobacteriales bacterium]|nr:NTP transferase domain-containing protein [Flavobacteriales bacterium]
MNKNNYCVIMAGGIGSRFWPMSKTSFPKQFHDVLGIGRSLIQMTFDRLNKVAPAENILVVTNDIYKDLVLEQLPSIQAEQVLCEPFMRNTAPCIAFANYHIHGKNPNANIIVAPADHLIMDEPGFIETIDIAIDRASCCGQLLTLGIEPSRPDTGYGYIQFEEHPEDIHPRIKQVKTFTEKPSADLAKEFIKSGDFYWNSGIFIWSLSTIMQSFQEHLPDMCELFDAQKDQFATEKEADAIQDIYSKCENISIDYGIMEKAENVDVVLSNFGWSDLGTWGSLYTHMDRDDLGNAMATDTVLTYDSNNNLVHTPKDKLVVLQGLDDCIVVDTGSALMICKMEDEQKIKTIVNELKSRKHPEL